MVTEQIIVVKAGDLCKQVNLLNYLVACEVVQSKAINASFDICPPPPVVNMVVIRSHLMTEQKVPHLVSKA